MSLCSLCPSPAEIQLDGKPFCLRCAEDAQVQAMQQAVTVIMENLMRCLRAEIDGAVRMLECCQSNEDRDRASGILEGVLTGYNRLLRRGPGKIHSEQQRRTTG